MPREPRAVLFDLDDTLYPVRRFRFSGWRAVARHVALAWGVDERLAIQVLARAARRDPGHELDALVATVGASPSSVPGLIDVLRAHTPALRLPHTSRETLARLRGSWRIGLVTNGVPAIQARKIDALGLRALVDTAVLAHAVGDGRGKPAREPFVEACVRLGVTPARAVFVGDDLRCDIDGARRVGMKTIWIRRGGAAARSTVSGSDLTLRSVGAVPIAAERLLPSRWSPYAA